MFKFKYRSVFTALAFLAYSAVAASAQALEIPSGEWHLSELNGRKVENSKAYIDIDVNAAKISGNAGCNRMFGTVAGGNGKLAFSKIGTTRMFCADPNARRTENQFINAIEHVTHYRETGSTLSLYARNRVVMKFTAVRRLPPEASSGDGLESLKWMLESIGGKKVSPNGAKAFISFDPAKQSAGGDTSCNAFGGSYELKGDKLSITGVIATMRACIEDDRMTIERQFLDGLEKTDRYTLSGSGLTLYQGRRVLLSFRGAEK